MTFPLQTTLENLARQQERPSSHLNVLLEDTERSRALFFQGSGLHLDLSRQRLDLEIFETLLNFARINGVREQFQAMVQGHPVNTTEKRAALHTAARGVLSSLYPEIAEKLMDIHEKIFRFTRSLHNGEIRGSSGLAFTHALVLGIGGSRLGTEALHEALAARHPQRMALRFLSTVDPNAFLHVTGDLDPARTLVIVISKSFTTREVHVNLSQVRHWLKKAGLHVPSHQIAITAKGSPGDDQAGDYLAVFHMFDVIGGRYSASSAVGSLPLSLVYGPEVVETFLEGCREMDLHAMEAPEEKNLPLLIALCDIWNGDYLGYPAFTMIPYAHPLRKFPDHMQQLYMESLGKALTATDEPLAHGKQAMLCFGDTGTDAQHSFFQMLHQGRSIPLEFIGVLQPPPGETLRHEALTAHEELWINLLAQANAFAMGRSQGRLEQFCPGNTPSSILTLDDLGARNIGRFFALLEARTVYTGFLKGINPFDQFGVENGKELAKKFRSVLLDKPDSKKTDNGNPYFDALARGSFMPRS